MSNTCIPQFNQIWRHKKRDKLYRILYPRVVLCHPTPGLDGLYMVVYQEYQHGWGHTYVRAVSDFMDGRFEFVREGRLAVDDGHE